MSDTEDAKVVTGSLKTDKSEVEISSARPTGALRWHGGVLEQQYVVSEWLTKSWVERERFEWRPVPTEEGDA